MRRNTGRSRRFLRTNTVDPLAAVTTLAAGRPVFSPYKVVEDPANLGFVLRIIDASDSSRYVEQTTFARQVAMPAAHADFGGRLCFNFTGAEWYVSNQALAFWRFLHDGTGMSLGLVHTQTSSATNQVLFNTRGGIGISVTYNAGSPSNRLYVGEPGAVIDLSGGGTVNVARQLTLRYTEAASPEYAYKATGVAETTGASFVAPSAANPASTLVFGAYDNTGSLPFIGRVALAFTGPDVGTAGMPGLRTALTNATNVAA